MHVPALFEPVKVQCEIGDVPPMCHATCLSPVCLDIALFFFFLLVVYRSQGVPPFSVCFAPRDLVMSLSHGKLIHVMSQEAHCFLGVSRWMSFVNGLMLPVRVRVRFSSLPRALGVLGWTQRRFVRPRDRWPSGDRAGVHVGVFHCVHCRVTAMHVRYLIIHLLKYFNTKTK